MKLKVLPEQAVIDGWKGKVDFYLWNGIPCARKWPVTPPGNRSPGEQASWQAFTWASQAWDVLSPVVQEAYRTTAQGSSLTARDLFIKSFISDYFREGQWG